MQTIQPRPEIRPPSNDIPTLGLIVPPAHGQAPSDGAQLYGDTVRFIARGLGIAAISREGFEPVMRSIAGHARALRDGGAQAISLMGTSISFYRGAAFTEDLLGRMQATSGVPCTTMSHAIVRALQTQGIRRVAVATAYLDALNARLVEFLRSSGFDVAAIRGLGMTDVLAVGDVGTRRLVELALEAHDSADGVDGLLIACGGLRTLDALQILETGLHLPAVASSPAGFWDLMHTAGLDPASPAHGRLFQRATRSCTDSAVHLDQI